MFHMFRPVTQKITSNTVLRQNVIRSFSSEASSGGIISRIKNTFGVGGGGSSSSQDDAYAKQISQMANAESWSLTNFHQQIIESSGGWKAKIPGMGSTDAVKQMKAMQQLLEATMEVAGSDACSKDLKELGKKEKLKISLKCGAELSEINELVQQFKSMDVMHRVLRYRVENGLEIPKDEESARNLMQKDVRKVLSERELKEMQRERMKLMRKR